MGGERGNVCIASQAWGVAGVGVRAGDTAALGSVGAGDMWSGTGASVAEDAGVAVGVGCRGVGGMAGSTDGGICTALVDASGARGALASAGK